MVIRFSLKIKRTEANRNSLISMFLGSLFRVIQTPDSDDDPTPGNSPVAQNVAHPSTVPTKMNGTNAPAYSSGVDVDDDQPNEVRHSRRKRNHSLTTSNYHYTNYSSHSSSRLSNSSSSDDDDTSSNDSSIPFFTNHLNKRPKRNGNNELIRLD